MSMFNDISWGSEDNERECNANADLVSIYARSFPAGRWSFLGPGSDKKWYSTYIDRPQGEWDRVAELVMIKFGESGHPVFRATSSLSDESYLLTFQRECELSAQLVSMCAKRFSSGKWSFLGPGSEKKWYSTNVSRPQGEWDRVAELMMIKFRESGHPVPNNESIVPRNAQKQRRWKIINTLLCTW